MVYRSTWCDHVYITKIFKFLRAKFGLFYYSVELMPSFVLLICSYSMYFSPGSDVITTRWGRCHQSNSAICSTYTDSSITNSSSSANGGAATSCHSCPTTTPHSTFPLNRWCSYSANKLKQSWCLWYAYGSKISICAYSTARLSSFSSSSTTSTSQQAS